MKQLNLEHTNTTKLLKQIRDKSAPNKTIADIRDSYYKHLQNHGNHDTYSDYPIEIIDAVNEHFPFAIDKHKCQALVNKKIQNVFNIIDQLIQEKRFNISNQTLQMYLNYLKPELKNLQNNEQSVTFKIVGDNFTKELPKS